MMERVAVKGLNANEPSSGLVGASMSEREAFSILFEEHVRAVLRYSRSRVGATHAEDIVSEAFAIAWRNRARFNPQKGSPRAWLLGIATNVISRERVAEQRWLRARGLASDLALDRSDASAVSAESLALDKDLMMASSRDLMRALRRMPRSMRDPLLLREIADLSYEEIAEALEVPLGTVRSRISRARQKLEGVKR